MEAAECREARRDEPVQGDLDFALFQPLRLHRLAKDFDKDWLARFTKLMLAMDGKDPVTAEILRLEQAAEMGPRHSRGL